MGPFLQKAAFRALNAVLTLFWLIVKGVTFMVGILYEALRKLSDGQAVKVEGTAEDRPKADPEPSRRQAYVSPEPSRPQAYVSPSTPERTWTVHATAEERARADLEISRRRPFVFAHTQEQWSIEPPFAPHGHPSFVGGPYDWTSVPAEAILHPANYRLNRPLRKWYSVGYGRAQGIWRTWAETNRLVNQVSNQDHESFKTLEEAEQWLTRAVQKHGVLPSLHRENVKFLGRDFHGHHVFFCPCCREVFCINS